MALPDFPGKLKNTSGPDLKLIQYQLVDFFAKDGAPAFFEWKSTFTP